ncbi:hypothetical protein D9M68_630490 [compost metagenome]
MHQGQMGGARGGVFVGHGLEGAPGRLHGPLADALDDGFVFASVLDQVGDGADLQAVLAGEFDQVGQARHGAVGLQDLADHRGGRQPGHGGQVAAGLGVARAHQHAAGNGPDREDVARLDQVGRFGVARHRHLDGAGAVRGRNAGFDAFGGLDRLSEVGTVARAVAGRHQGQVQLAAAVFGQGQAHQAAAVRHHEVDGIGRDEFGGHDEVAFIFAVFLVNQDDDTAGTQLGDDLGDRSDTEGFRLGAGQRGQLDGHGGHANQAGKPGFYRPRRQNPYPGLPAPSKERHPVKLPAGDPP